MIFLWSNGGKNRPKRAKKEIKKSLRSGFGGDFPIVDDFPYNISYMVPE